MRQQQRSLLEDLSHKTMRSGKRELFYEGRGKNLYHSEKPDLIIQEFKNGDTAEGKKETRSKELIVLRNKISTYLFKYLDGFHLPTHFVSKISESEMLVKRLEMIPLTIKIYNLASGLLSKRFGIKEGAMLNFPVIEHYQKSGDRNTTWVNEYHMYAFGIATPEELKQMNRIASKANAVLRGLCDRRQLILVDLQLEFGRYKGQVVLGDELSPYTCHFLDLSMENKTIKIRYLHEQNNLPDTYAALSDRLELRV